MRFLIVVVITFFSHTALTAVRYGSMFTETQKDCVIVSNSTPEADRDFYEAECKAFGGFQLTISGEDSRYSPKLSYQGFDITLKDPVSPHEMGSNIIEWIYRRVYEPEGNGFLTWQGLVYTLSVTDRNGHKEFIYYGIRLERKLSCVVAETSQREAAEKAVLSPSAPCLHY